eukprot:gene6630-17365_t
MSSPGGSPKKKVSKEGQDALNDRLFYRMWWWWLCRLTGPCRRMQDDRKLNKDDLDKMVESVYTRQMEKQKVTVEKNQKRLEEERQGAAPRAGRVEKRKAKEKSLEQKYQPPPVSKKLDKEKTKEVNSRLYEETKGKKEMIRAAMYEKHNGADIPKPKKLGKEQQAQMAQRLTERAHGK